MGRGEEAAARFAAALAASGRVESGMMQTALLANGRHYCSALQHLERTAGLLASDGRALTRSRYWQEEIARLRGVLQKDIDSSGAVCNPPDEAKGAREGG